MNTVTNTFRNPDRRFDGDTYNHRRDQRRLDSAFVTVFRLMRDGRWRSLKDIMIATCFRFSEVNVSSRLRDYRKEKFGSHTVDTRIVIIDGRPVYQYRLTINTEGGDHV